MLTNALEQQRLHHAYLFTGTRGVGKTTLGRILAKCLNCETSITAKPCETCPTCRAVDAGQFLDLHEVDAASRTKVEDTRDLLENVLYAPTQGRYKIYLIDEVHMLSNHSFNALLKTLEEPPAHVKFILATTDPKRLPVTILSRCLQFHLKRITPEQITQHLMHICTVEQVTFELPALEKLAIAADGSMRDALSLLDQAIAYGNGTVSAKEVYAMLGSVAQHDLIPLVTALATRDGQAALQAVAHLSERAPDFYQLLDDMIGLFHQMALLQVLGKSTAFVDEAVSSLTAQFTSEDLQLYYQIALLGKRDLAFTPSPAQGFEMTVLRMLAFTPVLSVNKTPSSESGTPSPIAQKISSKKPATIPAATTPVSATPVTLDWRNVLPQLGLTGMAYALAANCTLVNLTETKLTLALSVLHQPMLNPKLQERIAEALSRHLQKPLQLDITITNEDINTPVKQLQNEQQQKLNHATQKIMQNPQVKQLIDMYDATLDVSLLT